MLMGKTFARAGRISVVPMVCVATIMSLSACSIESYAGDRRELYNRHFTDISVDDGSNIYFASVGTCRVRLAVDPEAKVWTGSIAGVDIKEPTDASIRSDHRFDYCSNKAPGR
jgi:hypothetical protein